MPDSVIARGLGCDRRTVWRLRRSLGIESLLYSTGQALRAVVLACVPQSHKIRFASLREAVLADYGRVSDRQIHRALAYLAREGRLVVSTSDRNVRWYRRVR